MPIHLPDERDPDDLTDEQLATSSFVSSQSSSRYATGGPDDDGSSQREALLTPVMDGGQLR